MTIASKSVGVSEVITTAIFLLKIAIRWDAFQIGSLEAVAAPWFKDQAQDYFLQSSSKWQYKT